MGEESECFLDPIDTIDLTRKLKSLIWIHKLLPYIMGQKSRFRVLHTMAKSGKDKDVLPSYVSWKTVRELVERGLVAIDDFYEPEITPKGKLALQSIQEIRKVVSLGTQEEVSFGILRKIIDENTLALMCMLESRGLKTKDIMRLFDWKSKSSVTYITGGLRKMHLVRESRLYTKEHRYFLTELGDQILEKLRSAETEALYYDVLSQSASLTSRFIESAEQRTLAKRILERFRKLTDVNNLKGSSAIDLDLLEKALHVDLGVERYEFDRSKGDTRVVVYYQPLGLLPTAVFLAIKKLGIGKKYNLALDLYPFPDGKRLIDEWREKDSIVNVGFLSDYPALKAIADEVPIKISMILYVDKQDFILPYYSTIQKIDALKEVHLPLGTSAEYAIIELKDTGRLNKAVEPVDMSLLEMKKKLAEEKISCSYLWKPVGPILQQQGIARLLQQSFEYYGTLIFHHSFLDNKAVSQKMMCAVVEAWHLISRNPALGANLIVSDDVTSKYFLRFFEHDQKRCSRSAGEENDR